MVQHLMTVARDTGLDTEFWAEDALAELIEAILKGMREPTSLMLLMGRNGTDLNVPYDRDALDTWHDMIDEALK
jgi:hypothetical protein